MYLPPPAPSTESSIVIHPVSDIDMTAYLPPFHDELPIPEPVEPQQSYLPPETVSFLDLEKYFYHSKSIFEYFCSKMHLFITWTIAILGTRKSILATAGFATASRRSHWWLPISETKTVEIFKARKHIAQHQIEPFAYFGE